MSNSPFITGLPSFVAFRKANIRTNTDSSRCMADLQRADELHSAKTSRRLTSSRYYADADLGREFYLDTVPAADDSHSVPALMPYKST
jgi:hypothetical protein